MIKAAKDVIDELGYLHIVKQLLLHRMHSMIKVVAELGLTMCVALVLNGVFKTVHTQVKTNSEK